MSGGEETAEISTPGSGQGNDPQEDLVLPGRVAYPSLVFKLITTIIIGLMAGWVIATIKMTRSLHKPHNIFVANLMVAIIMTTMLGCLIYTVLTIASASGMEEYFSCNLLRLAMVPANVVYFTYLLISVDTVTAITFPLRYKQLMTRCIVRNTLIAKWIIAFLPFVPLLFRTSEGYKYVTEYGACIAYGDVLSELFFTHSLVGIIATSISVILNVYATNKAYQVYKKIQAENQLSGSSGQSEINNKLRHKLKERSKPIITLLVIVFGSLVYTIVLTLLYFLGKVLISSIAYHNLMDYIIVPNAYFAVPLLHPFTYGIYFKQIREPMKRYLKNFCGKFKCNSAIIAPQPPRTAWM